MLVSSHNKLLWKSNLKYKISSDFEDCYTKCTSRAIKVMKLFAIKVMKLARQIYLLRYKSVVALAWVRWVWPNGFGPINQF